VASIADVYVTVLPETSKVADGIRRAFKETDKDAREAGGRWKKEIEGQLNDVKVKVDADTTKARAEIDAMSRKDISVNVDVDRAGLVALTGAAGQVGQLGNIATGAAGQVGQLGGEVTKLSTAAGPAGLAAAVVLGSQALLELGGIAASASQSLILLPGLIGAAATAFGTLKLATMGFSDAIEAIRDPEKFAEALQALSPNAQEAARSIQSLLPSFDALKNATQDAFFNGVGGMLNQLANQYLPTIQSATTGIASAFNSMFSGLSTQLMTPETQQAISTFLNNTVTAFQNLAPAVAPLSKAFADLMAVGSGFLPGLAQAATDAANSFSRFITEASRSGQLQQWLGEGLATLKDLGTIAWDLGRALLSLAPLARDSLPMIVQMFHNMANIMPFVVEAMKPIGVVMNGVTAAVKLSNEGFESMKSVVQSVANTIIPLINGIGQAVNNMTGPLRTAIDAANALGANIPQIPTYTNINQLGGPGLGGGPGAQADRRGVVTSLPTAGLPSGSAAPAGIGLGSGLSAKPAQLPWGQMPAGYSAPRASSSSAINLPYTGTADPYGGMYGLPAGTNSGGYGGSGAQFPAWVYAVGQQFGVKPSTYPGHQETNRNEAGYAPNPGHENRGIDWSGTPQAMQSFADYLKTVPGMEQVIWNGAGIGTGDTVEIAGGRSQPGYFASDLAGHGNHVHTRQSGPIPLPGSDPMSSMYGGMMPGGGTGLTSNDMSLRNAQQRVNDTQHSQEQAEARLNELRAKGTATDRQLEAAEYAVAKAKREHTDAIDSLSIATDKYNDKAAKGKGGDSGMSSLGTDLMGGIAQFFGFDGSLFADPTQFGLMKFITGAANLKTADSGNGMAPTGGGGGGLFDLASQFMPGMPGGNSPNLLDAVQNAQTGGPGSPGPGNNGYQNSGIDLRGASFGDSHGELSQQLSAVTSSQNRWGPLLQNAPK
jgi:hypothetical protein